MTNNDRNGEDVRRQYDLLRAVFPDLHTQEALDFVWALAEQADQMGAEIQAPVCPVCAEPPMMLIHITQAFCGNDDCRVLAWNMTRDPATFLNEATIIDLERREEGK